VTASAPALAAQAKVPLVLHHLIATIDTVTWNDVVKSPFITDQFATIQAPFAHGVDGGRVIRMFGKYNFLQLQPANSAAPLLGDVGMMLASERPGGLEQIRTQGMFGRPQAYAAWDHGTPATDFYREWSDRIRPVGADSLSDRVRIELLQYTSDAAKQQTAIDSLSETNRSSGRFLAQYSDPKKLLAYLTAATLAVPVDDIRKIVTILQRDGIPVVAEGEGAIIKLDGFTLHLIPSWNGAGVKQLQFALTHPAVANPTYRFGPKSQLRFGPGLIAVWDFENKR